MKTGVKKRGNPVVAQAGRGLNNGVKAGVVVVSNDRSIFDFVKPHLVLLRDDDRVFESNYDDALEVIKKHSPRVAIVHCSYDLHSFLKLVERVDIPVIALFEDVDSEYLLSAYDVGITDFITRKSTSEEVLARVMFALKARELSDKYEDALDFLKVNNVVEDGGFYVNPNIAISYFLNKIPFGAMLLLSGNSDLEAKLHQRLRDCDVVARGVGNVFYVFLPYTNVDGAVNVVKKLSGEKLPLSLHAGICCHYGNKDFNALNNILENALNVAVGTNKEYIIIDENLTPNSNWLEKINSGNKNFKLFKQEFNKMLELVLTPIFYQMQTKYETRIHKARIFQEITGETAVFKIYGEYFDSEFRLKCSGFSSVSIDIVHNTKEKHLSIDINNLESKTLEVLLEEFIAEHRVYMEELC